ncbi:hypothetical protein [Pseudomonas sp. S9]|uniref:hypothetical protein n=1 Tax=Pseudomonas sp. S9 TaxID=686578 RepID=UPI00031538A0|nr:hypothetical protein [Pseudomonas sp. S9]
MKKLNPEKKTFHHNAGVMRWRNALKRKDKKYLAHRPRVVRNVLGQDVIVAPEYISIYELGGVLSPYFKTMNFINQIYERYRVRNCLVDFSGTKGFSAAALVVVYAAIEKAGSGRKGRANIAFSLKSPAVNKTIKSSNLLKLIRGHDISYSLDSARSMPIISSVGSEQMEEIIDYIQRRIFKDKMSPATEHIYGDAVSETINNVRLHAYPDTPLDEKRWWLMCSTFGKKLFLAIYDYGVGIPNTVVRQSWFFPLMKYANPDEYQRLVEEIPELESPGFSVLVPKHIPDERLIYYSMQSDVSGTKQEKHGQGSKSIKALVNDTDDGLLWVFSNNGLYTFSAEDQKPGEAKLKKSFPGTLVQWNIEIS